MLTLAVIFGAIWIITFLAAPTLGAGWVWDADNALGFAAFVGMLYLTTPGGARRDLRTHEWVGYTVLAIALVHAGWFLLADGAAVEYIKPSAPGYMWTGILSFLFLALLVALAVMPTRLKAHSSYDAFRNWHQAIAIFAIAGALHHIIVSGFYVRTWYQAALLIGFSALAVFARRYWAKLQTVAQATPMRLLAASLIGSTVFVAIRNLPL